MSTVYGAASRAVDVESASEDGVAFASTPNTHAGVASTPPPSASLPSPAFSAC